MLWITLAVINIRLLRTSEVACAEPQPEPGRCDEGGAMQGPRLLFISNGWAGLEVTGNRPPSTSSMFLSHGSKYVNITCLPLVCVEGNLWLTSRDDRSQQRKHENLHFVKVQLTNTENQAN